MRVLAYTAVMAAVTYLVRVIPFTLFRKQIKSQYIRSLLYYLPYAVLSATAVPAIFYSTGNLTTALVGTATALITAFYNKSLIVVAVAAALSALITDLII